MAARKRRTSSNKPGNLFSDGQYPTSAIVRVLGISRDDLRDWRDSAPAPLSALEIQLAQLDASRRMKYLRNEIKHMKAERDALKNALMSLAHGKLAPVKPGRGVREF
jgi:transposase-like protein